MWCPGIPLDPAASQDRKLEETRRARLGLSLLLLRW